MKAHKWGNGVGVCISRKVAESLGLHPGQEITLVPVRPGEIWIQWDLQPSGDDPSQQNLPLLP